MVDSQVQAAQAWKRDRAIIEMFSVNADWMTAVSAERLRRADNGRLLADHTVTAVETGVPELHDHTALPGVTG